MLITFVYVKCGFYDLRHLWSNLEGLFGKTFPWLVVGNLNYIRHDVERVGGRARPRITKKEFNQWIDTFRVVELKIISGNMNWTNGKAGKNRI